MNHNLNGNTAVLPPTSDETVEKIRAVADKIREYPQIEFITEHVFHAGMYARTVRIPAGIVFTSVLVKIPTILIVNGVCDMLAGDDLIRLEGFNVLPASSGRMQIYVTHTGVELTMLFPTDAETIEQAESQFTDEADILMSHSLPNEISTGVQSCLE